MQEKNANINQRKPQKMSHNQSVRSILSQDLAWKEYIINDDKMKVKSLMKGVDQGIVTAVPVPSSPQLKMSDFPKEDYLRLQSYVLRSYEQPRFKPRDIFGNPKESAVHSLGRLLQSRYPTDLQKGIERTKESIALDNKREGIKTYDEENKLPYMSTSINLSQPDFSYHTIQSPAQRSSKAVENPPVTSSSSSNLSLAGEMVMGKSRIQEKREQLRKEFYEKKRKDDEKYKKALQTRVNVKDMLLRQSPNAGFQAPTSNHIYGAYKQPPKFVVRPPMDHMKVMMSLNKEGLDPKDEAYLLHSIN